MALENTYLSIIKKENLSNWFIEIEATQITRLQYTIHNTLQNQQLDYQKVKVLWWQDRVL